MIRAAVVGASGYSGAELLKILLRHPEVTLEKVTANTTVGKRVDELYPVFKGRTDLVFEPWNSNHFDGLDVAFIALPSGEAMGIVPTVLAQVKKVIDLGGDFRLKNSAEYELYYRRKHTARELLPQAVYGLPEVNREAIQGAKLVANPGCYPTSVILALLPGLKAGLISPDGIVVSSLSGVSGAGRTVSIEMIFTEVNENIRAYKVGIHQHTPEIIGALKASTGIEPDLVFIPHLVPMNRGIYSTITVSLSSDIDIERIYEAYESAYASAPFVRITRARIPEVKDVVGTNYCDVGFALDRRAKKLVIVSAIDNLVKGAAGQAVQNMNIMFRLPEEEGLIA